MDTSGGLSAGTSGSRSTRRASEYLRRDAAPSLEATTTWGGHPARPPLQSDRGRRRGINRARLGYLCPAGRALPAPPFSYLPAGRRRPASAIAYESAATVPSATTSKCSPETIFPMTDLRSCRLDTLDGMSIVATQGRPSSVRGAHKRGRMNLEASVDNQGQSMTGGCT